MTIVLYDKLLQAVRAIVFLVWPRVCVNRLYGIVALSSLLPIIISLKLSTHLIHCLTRRLLEFVFNGLVLVGLKLWYRKRWKGSANYLPFATNHPPFLQVGMSFYSALLLSNFWLAGPGYQLLLSRTINYNWLKSRLLWNCPLSPTLRLWVTCFPM